MGLEKLDLYNKSEYSNEDVAAGKIVSVQLLGMYAVHEIETCEREEKSLRV